MNTGIQVAFKDEEPIKEKELPKPFPFIPPFPTERLHHRIELMMHLNMWDNNNAMIAKRTAETLILLLQEQFEIKPSLIIHHEEGSIPTVKVV